MDAVTEPAIHHAVADNVQVTDCIKKSLEYATTSRDTLFCSKIKRILAQ